MFTSMQCSSLKAYFTSTPASQPYVGCGMSVRNGIGANCCTVPCVTPMGHTQNDPSMCRIRSFTTANCISPMDRPPMVRTISNNWAKSVAAAEEAIVQVHLIGLQRQYSRVDGDGNCVYRGHVMGNVNKECCWCMQSNSATTEC
jgi:hypothetical protein